MDDGEKIAIKRPGPKDMHKMDLTLSLGFSGEIMGLEEHKTRLEQWQDRVRAVLESRVYLVIVVAATVYTLFGAPPVGMGCGCVHITYLWVYAHRKKTGKHLMPRFLCGA
jgi:hypothetical protein